MSQLEFFASASESAGLYWLWVTVLPCNLDHYIEVRDPYYRCEFGEYLPLISPRQIE